MCALPERGAGRMDVEEERLGAGLFARVSALLRRGPGIVHVALAALLLLAPVAVNGRPAAFFDTMDYLHEGEHATRLLGFTLPGRELTPPTPEAREQLGVADAIRASRSAAYGLWVYLSWRFAGLWLTAALQAFVASAVIYAFVRAVSGGKRREPFWAAILVLTLASALPFYAGFAMPDVFAAIGVLALTTLVVGADRLARAARIALFFTVVACTSMHTSHVLIAMGLGVAAFCVRAWLGRDLRAGLSGAGWALGAAGVSIVMFLGYSALVKAETGVTLRSPPFISARLLMDGPGRAYLAKACATGRPYTLCDYKTRRLTVSDDVLWSRNTRVGVFGTVDQATRTRLSEEDRAFALGVVRNDPVGVATMVARNIGVELVSLGIVDPLRGPAFFFRDGFWRHTTLPWVAPGAAKCLADMPACRSRLDPEALFWIHSAAVIAGVPMLAWFLLRGDTRLALRRPDRERTVQGRLLGAVLMLTAAILVNAVVCGTLSGPYARYQARIAWLIPMAAVCAATIPGLRRREV